MRKYPNPQYAIMLRGAWGCGKTFFIRQWMEQLKSNRDADKLKMAAYLCVFIRFDHYPANHRTNQQGNIPVVVQQGNETCQEYIKSRFENRFEIRH